ncbi:hypothetical protein F4827_002548 [Paraburkholderia bannensis]|uniref:Uncharacterized protein n=1 Tax=Paraburkholderia bannensis TaxID=765414 RepID=A0A7W9TXW3_9BURK|nr:MULTISPECIES: hypothetical protein [Paraburkholderia]MBB3257683.1 hypothetical protein [Paraburkholderia sp. WP4_3_2]MBB6102696.1 hypothetical protein [Paraburkholderia bannensis]
MNEKEMKLLIELSQQVQRLLIQTEVQQAALRALAEVHPSAPAVEQRFRELMEYLLSQQDDAPLPEHASAQQMKDANWFLDALKRDDRASE